MWHDDVIKHFPRYWPFVRGIHRSPVNSSHKGQWRGALMVSLICVWINGLVNNREAGDLRRHRAHSDVIVMDMWLNHSLVEDVIRRPWPKCNGSLVEPPFGVRPWMNNCIIMSCVEVIPCPPLLWRHNGCNGVRKGVSNYQPNDCLLNRLFRRRKENIKALRHWSLCGEFTGDRWIPRTKGE